jgi:SpoIID/LytB domain protein
VARDDGGVTVERRTDDTNSAGAASTTRDLESFPLDEMATGQEPDVGDDVAAAANGEWERVFTTRNSNLRIRQDMTPILVPVAGLAGDRLYARGRHEIVNVERNDGSHRLSTIQRVPTLEQYLYGLGEVPSGWGTSSNGGFAALQAQAVTARTFAVDRLRSGGRLSQDCNCHLLAGPADQAYSGWTKEIEGGGSLGDIWKRSVDDTRRTVMTHDGALTGAFYSSSHGGRSENVEDSWAYGTTPISYLRSVNDPFSLREGLGNPFRSWVARSSNRAMADYLSRGLDGTIRTVEQITVLSSTRGGTPRELRIRGRASDGTEVTGTFTRPSSDRKPIAAGNFRRDLSGLTVTNDSGERSWITTLPSSQLSRIGFGPFDDDDGRVHEYATVWTFEAGIAQGVSDTRFAPTRSVTRAQMASFIFRTYDIPASSSDNFRDVDPDQVHGDAINALADAGIAQGYEDGRFRPGASVTRAQMASFIARAAGFAEVQPDGRFTDVRSGTHAGNIHAIADAGITRGCRSDRYCPDDPVAREQMASFLYRAVRGER